MNKLSKSIIQVAVMYLCFGVLRLFVLSKVPVTHFEWVVYEEMGATIIQLMVAYILPISLAYDISRKLFSMAFA